ncbi:tRNA (guanosine(46)-N7)-methyltransferase TrmB [Oceanomicrobium pacificus]|uniref:tRNA (guanine-N(7)-)-methyltransferase n=1 Tax=Oceanomicrobium pacificus TaxID=2692916 RepID=A0A6B0TRS4_9RHOB|nr:tRNA (guanosine(46)-N7)-methyltransferase TrmB [Oceanomicrobium pacificus]MXU64438.1 tRNA (guanosine(46)-N7)-methyltransferase TrmB [Oceanomicrobium pacificus]
MSEGSHPSGAPWRNFYGRRHGKKLRKGQIEHLETTLKRLSPPGVTWEDNPDRTLLDLNTLFGDDRPVWLEVGFGGGEHILHQAKENPDVGLIGCEPFVNGVAMLVPRIAEDGVENIRVHMGDARDMLDVLPLASLDRAFLLYPDPWPKSRHHRRRFVVPENIDQLSRALKPGARFHVATDIPDYVRQTLEVVVPRADFEWLADGPEDWREPWSDWHRTRYEAKAVREGRTPHYLTFRRTDAPAPPAPLASDGQTG